MAGIKVKDPATRLNKYSPDVFADDDEELDLRVTWDNEEGNGDFDQSVTRMDEDTGSMGAW